MDRPASDDEPDYGAPPHLTMPAGTREEQLAWLRIRIQEGLDSGPPIEVDLDTFFDDVKRRGRERVAQSKKAA